MQKILVTEDLADDALALIEARGLTYDNLRPSRAELREVVGQYDGLIVRWMTRIDADLLDRAPRLKVIGRAGASLDNIDIDAATRRGVIVTNTPLLHSTASAEFVFGLLLALARQIPQAHESVKAGEWTSGRRFQGTELSGKVLGLVGFGRVGRDVAARAASFGMKVMAYDPFVDEAEALAAGVLMMDLDDLLGRADFVSLHAPLTEATKRLIGAQEVQKMKVGVFLVNTARGALIDEDAVAEGLKSGRIAGVAVDGFSREPPTGNSLLGMANVIATPHLGAATREAVRAISSQIVAQTLDALQGLDYRNVVNLPFANGVDFQAIRPHLVLAEKLGALQRQLAGGQVKRVEVEVRGGFAGLVKALTMALLKGLLGDEVNYINAPALAQERGIRVAQTKGMPLVDYPNLLSCRVFGATSERLVAGTLFESEAARIVQIDGFRLDGLPTGTILILGNEDVPGVIGRVGTLLGQRGINIAEWRLGRDAPGGRALSFINLDNSVPDKVVAELSGLSGISSATVVQL